jgi:hypothetical protein
MAFGAAAHVLRRSSLMGEFSVPHPKNVTDGMMLAPASEQHDWRKWHSFNGIDFFFDKGGQTDYAIDAILHFAAEQSPLGDGQFDLLYEEEAENDPECAWRRFPECANDLNFKLVRRNLGLIEGAHGPHMGYNWYGERSESESDDEEESDEFE